MRFNEVTTTIESHGFSARVNAASDLSTFKGRRRSSDLDLKVVVGIEDRGTHSPG